MSILWSILLVVQIVTALGMIGLILLQHGKGADMGAAFGSGASGTLFGATGSANALSRATSVAAGIFFVLRANFHEAITLTQHGSNYLLRLHKDVSFLNKALLRKHLAGIPDDAQLLIDGYKALFIDQDILETIADFRLAAQDRNIEVEIQGIEGLA